jgi:plasmid stability protein
MSETTTQAMPVSVVFPDELRARLVAAAREHERSVSAEIRLAVRRHLERDVSIAETAMASTKEHR